MRASTMLLYGATGSTKTSQIGFAARYHYAKTGKTTRLLSADSTWDPIADLVKSAENPDGIIEVFHLQQLTNPIAALVRLAEGWWPELDGQGNAKRNPKTNGVILHPPDLTKVGLYANEGLSTISDLVMQDHISKARAIGQDLVGKFADSVEEAAGTGSTTRSFTFAKAAMSHYDHVQKFVLLDLVPRFATLPVDRVIWTAHESKGIDEISGRPTALGPATIGKAAVTQTAQKFADTLHLDDEQVAGKLVRKAYYVKHPETGSAPPMFWPAKVSLPVEGYAEMEKLFSGGAIPLTLTSGIEQYLKIKDKYSQGKPK